MWGCALRPFAKAGSLGGYLEREANLSQEDEAWVGQEAKVYGNARVSAGAYVSGAADVSGFAQIRNNARVTGFARVGDYAQVDSDSLVHRQSCVFGNAVVTDRARVDGGDIYGEAVLSGSLNIGPSASISKSEDILSFAGLLAPDRQLTAYRTKDGTVEVCFGSLRGSLQAFRAQAETPRRYQENAAWQLLGLANLIEHHFAA
ncbi:hypothetical protein DIE18_03800 [Burkholderia sp. Bp9125]|nr:hypothetical protein DIE18_03800 [Burkholderia sp. Bp9125]